MSTDHEKQNHLLALTERIAGVGHWTFDIATGKITWSDEIYRIHGLPRTEAEPDYDGMLALYSPDDRVTLADLVARALATGEGYHFEGAITRPDGVRRHVVAKAECILNADGHVATLVGVFQDVTDQARCPTDSILS